MSRPSKVIAVNADMEEVTRQDFLLARRLTKEALLVGTSDLRRVEKVLKNFILDLRRPLDAQNLQRGRRL